MTVLARGGRLRRGGRRPGWVLLTALLVLAIGASSALVFTNRVELLKLAVILALWAAIAGAFVSVAYRRQSDADQSRVRDLKLVYDLQLDREISARREYELTVESQLRGELASELRAQAADEVAALRAELAALRNSLEILFDANLENRPALETDATTAHAYRGWARDGESPPADWVSSDRVTAVRPGDAARRTDEASIIDVPEVGVPPAGGGPLLPPRQPMPSQERVRLHYEAPPRQPDPLFEPSHRSPPPPPPPQPEPSDWQPDTRDGQWLRPGTPGSSWAPVDSASTPAAAPSGRRRRARHSSPEGQRDSPLGDVEPARQYGEPGRRARSRHSAEHPDYGIGGTRTGEPPPPPPPRLAPAPPAEPAPRHRSADPSLDGSDGSDGGAPQTGGQSVADLLARLQAEPTGGGRRRRRGG